MFKSAQTSITITARRTEITDAKEIVNLVNQSTVDLFGPCFKEIGRVFELIEKSVLSITLEDQSNKRLLAQACFNDFPNVHGVSPRSWEMWLGKRYDSAKLSTFNTLFMHLFVAEPEFSFACVEEIVKSVFKTVPECHYVLLCVPNNIIVERHLTAIFADMKRNEKDPMPRSEQNCTVLVANREKHLPVLHVRQANVNDNDDLIPLLNSYTEVLKSTYGDFYVAEMIEAQNEYNKCLTAEAEGFGIGFMAITLDVNVKLLNECFELVPFHGLHKPHPDDVIRVESPRDEVIAASDERRPSVIKHKLSYAEIIDTHELDNEFNTISKFQETINRDNANKHYSGEGSIYFGESNAFAIQLFCIEDKYDSRSMDFLQKAFEAFPDRDYCIITLPPNVPEFSLIQNFLRVTPRDINKINQELYIFHRAGLIKSFDIREASRSSDYAAVEKLVATIKSRESILKDLDTYQKSRKDPNGTDLEAYVAEALGRVIGIAIIRHEDDVEFLRANFNVEDFILFNQHKSEEHGHVNHFALIPIFGFLTKYFIREILRKSRKTCLYYPIYPEYCTEDIFERYSLITAINYMVPVRRRAQIDYNLDKLKINAPSDRVLKPKNNYQMPSSLNHINRKLLFEPKISINLRIVVVGGSDIGISFLETLVMCPHLRFNNLTLVSVNGIPGNLIPDTLRDRMITNSMNYDQLDYASMSLRSWINSVTGKMTSINRRKKYIVIDNGNILPYDHLILCTGTQYYQIAPMQAKVYNAHTKKDIRPSLTRPLLDKAPPNAFVVNNEYDAEDIINFIQRNNITKREESIVIYGLDLNVFCLVETLIEMGVKPDRIVIVSDKKPSSTFNNPFVASRILEELKKTNVHIHENYQMQEWNDGDWSSGEILTSIVFKGVNDEEKPPVDDLKLQCCLLFCFYKKDVDYSTFIALNNCHLVYDGRLVIDNDFHTNDSCIRAGGTLTKFKRSYYVGSWSHAYFNQKEIGLDMAHRFLKLVDPLLLDDDSNKPPNNDQELPPTDRSMKKDENNALIKLYKKPIISYALLPGGYYYLNVSRPGPQVTYEDERVEREEFVTNTSNGYFRIHLNGNKCVATITCLSKKEFCASNYVRLYGLHEQYLNKMILKFSQGQIKDFYEFFSESWCTAIFHDRFEELRKELRDLTLNQVNGVKSVSELLNEFVDKDLILTKDQLAKVKDHFQNSQTRQMIEKRILSYLNYNSYQLPMYSKPDLV